MSEDDERAPGDVDPEELEATRGEQLPDREAMSVISVEPPIEWVPPDKELPVEGPTSEPEPLT